MLRMRIKKVAHDRVKYGYERIHILLRREGWHVNYKRACRIYCEEGLHLRRKGPKRRVASAIRLERPDISNINQCWRMNFVAGELFDGKRISCLTVVDNFSRECLAIHVNKSIKADDVVIVIEQLKTPPKRIQVDNGSEFISKALDKWAYDNHVTLDFSRLGKATDNQFIESFNGSFREECLNCYWFVSMTDAQDKIEQWRQEYNHERPHTSLENLTPNEYRLKYQKTMSF